MKKRQHDNEILHSSYLVVPDLQNTQWHCSN